MDKITFNILEPNTLHLKLKPYNFYILHVSLKYKNKHLNINNIGLAGIKLTLAVKIQYFTFKP